MMAATAKPMHQDFACWYQTVSLGDNAARRQGRWEGVLNVVTNADRATVEALLQLAYGTRRLPAPSSVQSIRQGFKAADDTFEMTGNDRELQVLAGACLAVLMEDLDEDQASPAALAATTTALGTGRSSDLPMNLACLGERAIGIHGEERRKRPQLEKYITSEPPKLDFEKSAAKVQEQPNWDGVMEAFSLAADSTSKAFRVLASRQAQAIRAADGFIRLQDEELQMLWWLTSQYIEGYDCAFNSVPAEAQPFVFASELADATETLPGLPSVKAILSRAGLKARKKVELTAAVNALRPEWLHKMVEGEEPSPISTPLHFAIKRQLETGPGDAWVAGWAATTGIDAQYALPGLTLGELFYRERLLILFG